MLPGGLGILYCSPRVMRRSTASPRRAPTSTCAPCVRNNAAGLLPVHAGAVAALGARRGARPCCSTRGWPRWRRDTRASPRACDARCTRGGCRCARANRRAYSDTRQRRGGARGHGRTSGHRRTRSERWDLSLGSGLAQLAGQGVPHRPPGRPERAHARRRASAGVELALHDAGITVTPGSGVAAAAHVLAGTLPLRRRDHVATHRGSHAAAPRRARGAPVGAVRRAPQSQRHAHVGGGAGRGA